MPTPENPQDNYRNAKAEMITFALQHDRPTAPHDEYYPANPAEGLSSRKDKVQVALLRSDRTLTGDAVLGLIGDGHPDPIDPANR